MADVTLEQRLDEFFEYKIKSAWNLLRKGEFSFLAGATVEELTGRNPYLWYRKFFQKDQFVTRAVRNHEMWLDLYDRGISRRLLIRGIHEAGATEAYRTALTELSRKLDGEVTVLEVGGNIGYYVLEVADALGDRVSIVAFEPDPKNRQLLEKNIEHNGYSEWVTISPKAVDKTSGEQTFCRSTHSNWNRLERETATGNVDEFLDRFTVETTSLDDFLVESGMEPGTVNAIRMDLEGHELNVLEGMTDMLSEASPLVMYIEFHPDFGSRDEYEEAISTLEAHGFSIQFVGQNRSVLDIDSFNELRSVAGRHVQVIVIK